MPVGIASRRARKDEAISGVTALIEGDDGREAFVVIGSMGNRCDALPAPQRSADKLRTPKATVSFIGLLDRGPRDSACELPQSFEAS